MTWHIFQKKNSFFIIINFHNGLLILYVNNNVFYGYISGYEEAVFTMSKKGKSKLVKNGYMFVRLHESKGKGLWECTERRNHKCRGKARTMLINLKQMVQFYCDHNHPPVQTDKYW